MILVPGTASAQETPFDGVVDTLQQVAASVTGGGAAPAATPSVPGVPELPGVPALPEVPTPAGPAGEDPVSDDDSAGHETEDPEFPDHASGHVGDILLNDEKIAELINYDATINDDGTTTSDSTVLSLLGNEIVGSSASSDGDNENGDNLGQVVSDLTGGVVGLGLLYHDTAAFMDDVSSVAGARGGVLALCLLGDDSSDTASYECNGPIQAGVAEGLGIAERDAESGHTEAESANEVANACLLGTRDSLTDACDGLLGLQALHSNSASESETPDTTRHSYLVGFDAGGNEVLQIDDPLGLAIPPDCGEPALLCLFLNQGESFIFENGAASAQEALHLDLLNGLPLDILVELGQAETIVHQVEVDGDKPECSDKIDNDGDGAIDYPADKDCDSPEDDSESGQPECSDKIDNDGDGAIDYPADKDCESPEDDSEGSADNGAGDGGLADTGADVAPLLAGAFLLIGMGALTVAATRRRVGKHTV